MAMNTTKRRIRKRVLLDEAFDGNDQQIEALKECVRDYCDLHDLLSEMIEDGRLRRRDVPKDYWVLVNKLTYLADEYDTATESPEKGSGAAERRGRSTKDEEMA